MMDLYALPLRYLSADLYALPLRYLSAGGAPT
jgi:hypothetical protein